MEAQQVCEQKHEAHIFLKLLNCSFEVELLFDMDKHVVYLVTGNNWSCTINVLKNGGDVMGLWRLLNIT